MLVRATTDGTGPTMTASTLGIRRSDRSRTNKINKSYARSIGLGLGLGVFCENPI